MLIFFCKFAACRRGRTFNKLVKAQNIMQSVLKTTGNSLELITEHNCFSKRVNAIESKNVSR